MAKIVLAGGSGFLGQALGRRLAAEGWEVVVLSRQPRDDAPLREVAWNAETGGAWAAELEGAAAVVNFAGRSINCVHTLENSREILESRRLAVQALGKGWARAKNPPPVWIQCSATGYYGNAGDRFCDETLASGPGFLAEVCRQWEEAFAAVELPGVRRVVLRLGVVLDAEHGALPPLAQLVRRFLGGSAGSGRQFLSWVHRDDVVAAFVAVLTRPELSGVFNLCAPGPVSNAEFMRTLRRVLGRPWSPPAPEFAIRLAAGPLLGVDPNLALHGQRCAPQRLLAAGFQVAQPRLEPALRELLGK
ncbi:Epimerase family protein [Lacunisphaera limnophila]|uniref:Epimerase family protein n=1 Tax=Lacunisphaera limnophila TaxID=1838286 RepID=A0A1D8AT32_9BACT|nr:TIGR01777 family oxidoreductase [Lacunisphaera limnophila]AOS44020.1 Epimerase family protein [Lacunisphaera limnophila]